MMQRQSQVKRPHPGETRLDALQRHPFDYFLNETNLANGLVANKSQPGAPASDGPGWTTRRVNGIECAFFDYAARGVPYGPDDGTVAPWAVVASLPFAPEIVMPTIAHFQDVYPQVTGAYCFRCSFNLSFQDEADADAGWTSPYHFGINLGPVVLMCENFRTDLLWRLMRACPYVVTGLRRGGFTGGWL
ncbi:glucoamylase family protein [Hoeflea sp.]|jgi:hypothetical protein|uniref:glucoamylase family protein n=1 Tax=Hoeflea sp. TaxID=1940281 RepID=UPI0025C15242|nr:glucoamylase family protein [Hoeflea sp.]|tara:strand:- start:8903 stop:9469 length:567 start_codon:yes stop_codon:yes gene_type:complete